MNPYGSNYNDSFTGRLLNQRWQFLGVFFLVFFISYVILVAIDFVPEPKAKVIEQTVKNQQGIAVVETTKKEDLETYGEPVTPKQIYIERLDKTITVLNPSSRIVEDLDAALLKGVVRHPDSAKLGQPGNVFILGHSSYLPVVLNSNFQAFNGIQDLEWGDIIEVTAQDQVFVYRVDNVYRAEAQGLVVPIAGDENKLTLATCDSFGSVNDRFIVEATQIEVRDL